jgi:hypothetical protein
MQQPSFSLGHHTAFDWRARLRAAAIHLGLSVLVAAVTAMLVFAIWYPYPYREISGGRELFQLLVAVDIVLGPLLTFAVFNRAKPRGELRRDLAVIVVLQLAGLSYGLWTVHLARPVHGVRIRPTGGHQIDIPRELEAQVPAGTIWHRPGPDLAGPAAFRNARSTRNSRRCAQRVQLSARPNFGNPTNSHGHRCRRRPPVARS